MWQSSWVTYSHQMKHMTTSTRMRLRYQNSKPHGPGKLVCAGKCNKQDPGRGHGRSRSGTRKVQRGGGGGGGGHRNVHPENALRCAPVNQCTSKFGAPVK